jgi:hypothetical protein
MASSANPPVEFGVRLGEIHNILITVRERAQAAEATAQAAEATAQDLRVQLAAANATTLVATGFALEDEREEAVIERRPIGTAAKVTDAISGWLRSLGIMGPSAFDS